MTVSAYSPREELTNCLIHGLGIAAGVVAVPWLVWTATRDGDTWRLVSGLVFGISAMLLFTTSVLYHSATEPRRRNLLRRYDHCAIYLLIAGTYTPPALGVLRGSWGWALFAMIWTLALLGIAAKVSPFAFRFHRTSVLLYVIMGWLVVVAARPLMRVLTPWEQAWLVAGGLFYMIGVPFYLWKSRHYTHAIWHVFVLAGVACHFVSVLSMMSAD